jgi:hypothetical protein
LSLFTVDLERDLTFTAIHSFLQLGDAEDRRPQEGPRLDFKEDVPSRLGDLVTAYANTFGGLIFLGVKERKRGQIVVPEEIVGLGQTHDSVKAKLINIVLTTVQPRPTFSVGVVAIPHNLALCVAVLRVEEGLDTPYMYIQGQENRVAIRVGDTVRAASRGELTALFERGSRVREPDRESPTLAGDPYVMDGNVRVSRFQRLTWIPSRPLRVRLDRLGESTFGKAIQSCFRRDRGSQIEIERTGGYSDYDALNESRNFHRKWRVLEDGVMCFISKMGRRAQAGDRSGATQECDYCGDWIIDALSFVRLAQRWAEHLGYLGSGTLVHEMSFVGAEDVVFEASMPSELPCEPYRYDRMSGLRISDTLDKKIGRLPYPSRTETSLQLSGLDPGDVAEAIADSFLRHFRHMGGHAEWKRLVEEVRHLLGMVDGAAQ